MEAAAIFHGLDFWAPNVNIFRDPRWGRGQETYGEDPFLTARMGVAFVTGMQGDNPTYYRVISTPKHFDVHSGPEPTRHFADVDVSRHDQVDTYEPAFRAAIVEGKAGSVMCSYNAINGQPACANPYLLQELLRGTWGFQGYVVSDCGAVRDIFSGHHYRPTQAQASAISLERGMDNECVDFTSLVKDDHDYKPYVEAVQQGYLSETAMDTALVRLFTARIRLGLFDPPSADPYAKVDDKDLNSPEHRALALKLAEESMVLLKNDGTLPIKPGTRNILVVGPLADQTAVLLGNYNGTPTHTVSLLEGLKAEFPDAHITYVPGTQFLRNDGQPAAERRAHHSRWQAWPASRVCRVGRNRFWFERKTEAHHQPRGAECRCEHAASARSDRRKEVCRRAMDGIPYGASYRRLPHWDEGGWFRAGVGRRQDGCPAVRLAGSGNSPRPCSSREGAEDCAGGAVS